MQMPRPPRPKPAPASRPGATALGTDDVVQSALALAGEHGLAAVSIRGVAAALGISPMTVYRFVASKDDLLDAIVARAMDRMEIPYSPTADWRARVVDVMTAWHDLLDAHPSVVQILVERRVPAGSQGLGRLTEHVLAALEHGGVTGDAAVRAFWQLFSLTFGHIVFERSRRAIDRAGQLEAAGRMRATARDHGFGRVEALSGELTDLRARGSLQDALGTLLAGLG